MVPMADKMSAVSMSTSSTEAESVFSFLWQL
jgi:hypothetical protein